MQGIQELQQQFNLLLEMSPQEQRAFLDELGRRHPGRAARLLRMIGCHTDAVLYFDQRYRERTDPSQRFVDHLLYKLQELKQPETIGPYRILERLGTGGMGIVYKAAQDAPLKRTVAIKLLRAGAQGEDMVRHLARETATLAQLKHGGIPPVFEVGVENGQPYLVMEHVEGLPINVYCREKKVPLPGRLALISQVCEVLLYCHGRGLIHGDLKPANVLVVDGDRGGGRPQVKVIDFGIARALADHEGMTHLELGFQQPRGSVAYMAPEQAQPNNPADVRNDVYSLGAMLYELLTGLAPERPQAPTTYPFPSLEALQQWLQQPLIGASRAVLTAESDQVGEGLGLSRKALARLLRPELDALLARATDPDPELRLANVVVFHDELQRFAQHQLLETAKPYPWWLKLKKMWHRNPFRLMTYALNLLLLVSITHGWWGTAVARNREAQVKNFFDGFLTSVHPAKSGPDVLLLEVLRSSAEELDREGNLDAETDFELRRTLGISFYTNGYFGDARREFGKMADAAVKAKGKGSAVYAEAMMYLGKTEEERQNLEAAFEWLSRAVDLAERTMASDDRRLLEMYASLASVELERKNFDRAAGLAHKAVLSYEGRDDKDRILCFSLLKYGAAKSELGEDQVGIEAVREGLRCYRRLNSSEMYVATALHHLTNVLIRTNHPKEAVEVGREAVAVRERVTPLNSKTARVKYDLARALQLAGQTDEAIKLAQEALTFLEKQAPEAMGDQYRILEFLIQTEATLSPKTTVQRYRQLVAAYRKNRDIQSVGGATALNNLGHFLIREGNAKAALACLDEALAIRRELPGDQARARLVIQTSQAFAHNRLGAFETAREIMDRVKTEAKKLPHVTPRFQAQLDVEQGTALFGLQRYEEACALLEPALSVLPTGFYRRAEMLDCLVEGYRRLGRDDLSQTYQRLRDQTAKDPVEGTPPP